MHAPRLYFKVVTNEEALLQEQNCVQDARNAFEKNLKTFFLLSRYRFSVFNICCIRVQKRRHFGNTEDTLTLNVSPVFPSLRNYPSYSEDKEFASRSKNVCFLPVCSPIDFNVSTAMFSCLRRPLTLRWSSYLA